MNSKQFAPVSCVPQQAVPYALRLGSISDNECPALWDGQYSKSLILEYGEGHQELALNVVEGWALQLYLQSTSTNLSIDIFDPSLGTAFTTLVKLHGIAKTTGLPNGIRLHKYENDYRKIFEELRIEARDRKEFLSNVSDSGEVQSWRALLTEDVGAHPLKILLLNSLHVIKDIGQEGAALAELVKFGAALGIVIWVVAETSTLSASSSEYERERDRWRAWFSNDIERHVCKFSLQENKKLVVGKFMALDAPFCHYEHLGGIEVEELSSSDRLEITTRWAATHEPKDIGADLDFINVKVGTAQGRDYNFRLGAKSQSAHAAMVGQSGSGKTSFLNNLLICCMEQLPPSQLQFYLFDYKDGVNFGQYKNLEHVPQLHLDTSDFDGARKVLLQFQDEIKRRNDLFVQFSARTGFAVTDIASYNENATHKMPHWVLVIDETQRFLALGSFDQQKERQRVLQDVAARGRSAGLSLFLIATSFAGTNLDKTNISLRIAFKLANLTECRDIFEAGNEAPMELQRQWMVVNDNNGRKSANQIVRCNDVTNEQIQQRIAAIRDRHPPASYDVATDDFAATKVASGASLSMSPLRYGDAAHSSQTRQKG